MREIDLIYDFLHDYQYVTLPFTGVRLNWIIVSAILTFYRTTDASFHLYQTEDNPKHQG